ncbi:His Kinase A (phospho-acceptor) domain-containing protein [Bryocella elongata]|uniref:histidine kinase n=2 Tax=Bryocella elongata TaxID=863522 RepID=A0A1H5UNI6_9BACT|nr:His Kinase A (phospho-acceptor) domain-containing protein [Bryocella elongata]
MASFLDKLEKPCHVVGSIAELCHEIAAGAGAAIVTEEAFRGNSIDLLQPVLSRQPSWSDFPLLILVAGGRVTAESERLRTLRQPLGNVLLLERPLRPEILVSTLDMALRGRARQYQIRDQMQQFERAQEALRRSEKLAVTGRLAASIAHEINNPLEALTNLLYLVRTETHSEEAQRYLMEAEQELARVAEITKHTLRFYREPNQPTQVDLVEVVDSVLALYHSRLVAAKIVVEKEVRVSSLSILASPGELRQVIANIVGNALDAMRHGGILRLRLSVTTRNGNPKARLSIADTGHGIPPEILSTIFEPFITTKGETGTGLGLWVSDEIAKKNGWSMQVYSCTRMSRSGTVFSILMPT